MPTFTESTNNYGPGRCESVISWNYPFTQQDNRANPAIVFVCTYASDGTSCNPSSEQDVCASCGQTVFDGLDVSKEPYVTYSDTCNSPVVSFRIGQGCEDGVSMTTPDIVVTKSPQTTTQGNIGTEVTDPGTSTF